MTEQNQTSRLIDLITPLVAPLGYEIVHLEVANHRQKALRIYIDHLSPTENKGISIADCVAVTRALDEPLDAIPEIEKVFQGNYELEVSSPGVDRPLRTPRDFERFAGREIRIHLFRPLTAEELRNPAYQSRNPKQKNFIGTLKGFRDERILLAVSPQSGVEPAKTKSKSKSKTKNPDQHGPSNGKARDLSTNSADEVSIPLPLIAKANLEPRFETFAAENERE